MLIWHASWFLQNKFAMVHTHLQHWADRVRKLSIQTACSLSCQDWSGRIKCYLLSGLNLSCPFAIVICVYAVRCHATGVSQVCTTLLACWAWRSVWLWHWCLWQHWPKPIHQKWSTPHKHHIACVTSVCVLLERLSCARMASWTAPACRMPGLLSLGATFPHEPSRSLHAILGVCLFLCCWSWIVCCNQ